MSLWRAVVSSFSGARSWARHHGGEVLWAIVFAVIVGAPFALLAAQYLNPLPAYTIYLVAGKHFLSGATEGAAGTKAQFEASFPKKSIYGVDVHLQVVQLNDDDSKSANEMASELTKKNDTLMVIGHLDSEPTETSLHIYLDARPQVPFIASVQSDDNLLSKACKTDSRSGVPVSSCYDGSQALPYLQLSPTNLEQAKWAIRFATERGKRKFLIVEYDGVNKSYADSLADDYGTAIKEYNDAVAQESRKDSGTVVVQAEALSIRLDALTDEVLKEKFERGDLDCVLYAGSLDGGRALAEQVAALEKISTVQTSRKRDMADSRKQVMLILDDSVVDDRFDGADFRLASVNVTDQTDAIDYQNGKSVYGLDAIAIASQLIDDLNRRPADWLLRAKSWGHLQTVNDARRNLVRVMQENFQYRSSYYGLEDSTDPAPRAVYAFDAYVRANGMFHVWERSKGTSGFMNSDVDRWHPLKGFSYAMAAPPIIPGLSLVSKVDREHPGSHR